MYPFTHFPVVFVREDKDPLFVTLGAVTGRGSGCYLIITSHIIDLVRRCLEMNKIGFTTSHNRRKQMEKDSRVCSSFCCQPQNCSLAPSVLPLLPHYWPRLCELDLKENILALNSRTDGTILESC